VDKVRIGAGPLCVVLSGTTQPSIVISLLSLQELMTLVAAPPESISTRRVWESRMVREDPFQTTALGLLIVKSRGVPKAETSWTTDPSPSSNT